MLGEGTKDAGTVESYDAIILGAGISGLVAASVLLQRSYRRVLVVDSYRKLGGNHIDWSRNGYTFDAGSLIFQDDSPLLRHFPELLPLYKPIEPSWSRLNPQGVVTAYPISFKDDLLRPGLIAFLRICSSVVYSRLFQRRISNAREFARYWIGSYLLTSSGLESYMRRFYGLPPDQIDIELAQKRMLWISENASLLKVVRRLLRPLLKRASPSNRQLVRPKEGFNHLYEAAAARLRRDGVTFFLGTPCHSIKKVGSTFNLQLGDQTVRSNRVISTIPIDHVQAMCGVMSERLDSVTLVTLFFSFSGERAFASPILYNFSHQGAWKRLTMHSDFYGRVNGREYFSVEVVGNHVENSAQIAEQDFASHVRSNGLFDGDLKLEGSMILENAYPVYTKQSGANAAKAIRYLEDLGIESFGRQGGFNYQPTARVSTLEAEASLSRGRTGDR